MKHRQQQNERKIYKNRNLTFISVTNLVPWTHISQNEIEYLQKYFPTYKLQLINQALYETIQGHFSR